MPLENTLFQAYHPFLAVDIPTPPPGSFPLKGHRPYKISFRKFPLTLDRALSLTHPTLSDEYTLELIQIADLHESMDLTSTRIGSATLYRSLLQPAATAALVNAKQEAVRELEQNKELRQGVEEYIARFEQGEKLFWDFFEGKVDVFTSCRNYMDYAPFQKVRKTISDIADAAASLPLPESPYLQSLFDTFKIENTRTYALAKGTIYKGVDNTILPQSDVSFLTNATRFYPSWYSLPALGGILPTALVPLGMVDMAPIDPVSGMMLGSCYLILAGFKSFIYMRYSKIKRDYVKVMAPFANTALEEEPFVAAVDAMGKLDELLSFVKYHETMSFDTAMPQVVESPFHLFSARDLRNPILAREMEHFVPNDVSLEKVGLTFVTGPNSAGKTTLCKTIAQAQIMAQIGSYIPASAARISIANQLFYQAPSFDSLRDEEGRFGTEFERTRDIFYAATPRTVVILDELAEGTTVEEKKELSHMVLRGFHIKRGNTLLVTHNHQLAAEFKESKRGQFWKGEFDGENPTHRFIPGISRVSHAQVVAKRLGFSAEDIERHLKEKGYIS